MNKLSITRALAELKTLKKRSEGIIPSMVFVDAYQNRSNTLLSSKKTKQDFENETKANLQSIYDIIDNQKKIKAAIVASNAITNVTIGKEVMSVAAAIETKKSIELKKTLLKSMKLNWNNVKNSAEKSNVQVENNLQSLLTSMFGADKKTDPTIFEETSKSFRLQNEVRIFDPAKIETKIKELEEEIVTFEGEVDFALSESNAKTEIEIY